MMANLYDITKGILECVDMKTGEILDAEKLDSLKLEKDVKLENIALWYKNLLSDSEAYKKEKETFAEKEKAAKNKAESLKKYLCDYLNGEKFKTTKVNISYRKSESVIIDDLSAISKELLKYKDPDVDKVEIKKLINAGKEVAGAHVESKQNIQIK